MVMNLFFSNTMLIISISFLILFVNASVPFTYTTSFSANEQGGYITPSKDNQYFVAGSSTEDSIGGYDIVVRKISASGTNTWTQRYGCELDDYATDVALDKYGFCIVLGSRHRQCDITRPVIPIMLNYSSNGVMIWAHEVLMETFTARSMMVQSVSGSGIVLTGYDGVNGALVYLSNGDTRIIKTASTSISPCYNVIFEKSTEDLSRNIASTGYCFIGSWYYCVLALYDGTTFLKSSYIDSYTNFKCSHVIRSATGSFVLTGYYYGGSVITFIPAYFTSYYRWYPQYEYSIQANINDKYSGIWELPDGNLVLAGSYYDYYGNSNVRAYLLDPSFMILNQASSSITFNHYITGISTSKTGEIIITGLNRGAYTRIFAISFGCSLGWYSNPSSVCLKCDPGFYMSQFGQPACSECGIGSYSVGYANYKCTLCSAGTYNDITAQTSCKLCPTGTYASTLGRSYCTDCATGTYADTQGRSACIQCAPGTYNSLTRQSSSSACISCSPGTYQPSYGQASCLNCPVGQYMEYSHATACNLCNAGTYNQYTGQSSISACLPCALGYDQISSGQSTCNQCIPGYYADVTGLVNCKACPAGKYNSQYAKTSLDDCFVCPIGTYQPYEGRSSCFNCPAGYYQDQTGQTECKPCAAGKYNPLTGQTSILACLDCEVGTANPVIGQAECPYCLPGYYQPDKGTFECIACPQGMYQDMRGQISCKDCEVGKYNDATAMSYCPYCSAGTYQDEIGKTSCKQCDLGMEQPSIGKTFCTDCVPGTYADTLGTANCKQCTPGTYGTVTKSTVSTDCLPCPIGKAQPNYASTSCDLCLAGEYQDIEGQATCKACPVGTANAETGKTLASDCIPCTPGHFADFERSSTCKDCSAGSYQSASSGTTCTPCEEGTAANDIARGTPCEICPVGQYALGTGQLTCSTCLAGTYQDMPKSNGCKDCEAGTASDVVGRGTPCTPCGPGYITQGSRPTTCTACDPGYFQIETKNTVCTPCAEGTASNVPARPTECPACLAGSFAVGLANTACTPCLPGSFQSGTGSTGCTSCLQGTASNEYGRSSACPTCLPGTYAVGSGNTVCSLCAPGSFQSASGASGCTLCSEGTASNDESRQTACPDCSAGTYASGEGNTACSPCAAGSYQSATKSTGCIGCAQGTAANDLGRATACPVCSAGTYASGAGNTACTPCAPGSFQTVASSSGCTACPEGSASNDQGRTTTCQICLPGTYALGEGNTACTPCAEGTYQTASSAKDCINCPVGTASNVPGRSTACDPCEIGYFSNSEASVTCSKCLEGQYQDQTGQTTCKSCDPGTASNVQGLGTVCPDCSLGTYASGTGNTICLPLPAGSYSTVAKSTGYTSCTWGTASSATGRTTPCDPCSPGYFADNEGMSACSPCTPGTYQPEGGKQNCISCMGYVDMTGTGRTSPCPLCPVGTFYAGLCTSCPAGSYQDTPGSNSCVPCPKNTYCSSEGASSATDCIPCSAGEYTTTTGSTTCLTMPAGSYVDPITGELVTCQAGTKLSGQSCVECAAGSYQQYSGMTTCELCPQGTYYEGTGATQCTGCSEGTFNSNTGSTSSSACTPCAEGSYNQFTNQAGCTLALPGQYASQGATYYSLCSPGTYQPESGKGSCIPCTAGYYQPGEGTTSCNTPCPVASYSTGGAFECTLCEVNTIQLSTGKSSCDPCPLGGFTLSAGSNECLYCGTGQFLSNPSTGACSSCLPGSYSQGFGAMSCTPCAKGTVQPNGGAGSCDSCAAGSYQDEEGKTTCKSCLAGSVTETSGQEICRSCDPGTVQPSDGSNTCIACELGTFQGSSGGTTCSPCPAGQEALSLGSTTCTPCQAGYYKPSTGKEACQACPAGQEQPETGKTSCSDCQLGYFAANPGTSTCSKCPAGQYSDSTKSTSCKLCDPGKVQNLDGQSTCTDCIAGYYQASSGKTTCDPCPPGKYSTLPGQSVCIECEIGQEQPETGKTGCINCQPGYYQSSKGQAKCLQCDAGKYSNAELASSCTECLPGQYQNAKGQTLCNPCDLGTVQPLGGQSTCNSCGPGTFQDETGKTLCKDCPVGQFQPDSGKSSCTDCLAGTFNDQLAQSTCQSCQPGQYQDLTKQTSCKLCDIGTYQPDSGKIACLDCQPGEVQPEQGKATCNKCLEGYAQPSAKKATCDICLAGNYASGLGNSACTKCSVGWYQPDQGKATCIICPAGQVQDLEGQTTCNKCGVGKYQPDQGKTTCLLCAVGYYQGLEGQATCSKCLVGTVTNIEGSSVCTQCEAGTSQPEEGKTACIDCLPGNYQPDPGKATCIPCPIGKVQPSSKSLTCSDCLAGTVQPEEGKTTCIDCDPGYYQPDPTKATCIKCPIGQVQPNSKSTSCSNCLAGTVQPEEGKTTCIDCDPGYYQPDAGKATCNKCPIGQVQPNAKSTTCNLCESGTSQPEEGKTVCIDCLPGFYQPDQGKDTCSPCPIGQVQPNSKSSTCTLCLEGTVQPDTGKTTCNDCPVGYFQAAQGKGTCDPCPIGEFTNDVKTVTCTKCDVGMYQPNTGQTTCLNCELGKVQPETGKGSCNLCELGEFQDTEKQTTCKKCPAGKYQGAKGQSECLQCPEGTAIGTEGAAECTVCDTNYFSSLDYTKCLYWGVFDTVEAFDADQVSKDCRPSGVLTKPYTAACRDAFHTLCCDGATKKAAVNCNPLLGIAMTGNNLKDKYCSACYFLDSSKCPADQLCWDDSKYLANTDNPFPTAGYTVPCLESISGYCGPKLMADIADAECAKIVDECGATLVTASYGSSWSTFRLEFTKKLPSQLLNCVDMFEPTKTPGILDGNVTCTRESDTVIAVSVLGLAVPLTTFGFKLNTVKDACGIYINIASQAITPPTPDSILIYGTTSNKCLNLTINTTITKSYTWDIGAISWDVSYDNTDGLPADTLTYLRTIGSNNKTSLFFPEWYLYAGRKLRIQASFLSPYKTTTVSNLIDFTVPPTTSGKPYCGPCQLDSREKCPLFNGVCWDDDKNITIKGPNNSSDCIKMIVDTCYDIWSKSTLDDPQCADFVDHLNYTQMKIWPKLLSAYYSTNGKSIIFVLDKPVRVVGAGSCNDIFNAATLKWLPRTCSINWVNLTSFSVDYDTANGIMTEATVISGALFYSYPYSKFSVNETTVNVTLPKFEPEIQVTGSRLLSQCDTANLFASIVTPTLYTVAYKWEIEFPKSLADNLKTEAQTLFAPLSQYSSATMLTIPSKFMVRGSEIIVNLTAKAANFNFDTIKVTTVLKVVANVPKISIGSKTQLVLELEGTKSIKLPIQTITQVCGDNPNAELMQVDVKLLVSSGDNATVVRTVENSELALQNSLNSVYADFGAIFVGARQGFLYSKYYNITAAVIDKVSGLYNSDYAIIFLVRPPIKAVIESAGSLVSILSDVKLSGENSDFPASDDETKEFSWKCVSASPMELGSVCTCPLIADSALKRNILIIPKDKLVNICKYVYGLSVSSYSKNSKRTAYNETEFMTFAAPVDPVVGQVIDGTSNVVQDEYFTFKIAQKPGEPEPAYEWSLTEIQSMDPAVGTNYTEKNTFIYDFFKSYLNANINPAIKDNDKPLPGGRRLLEEIAPAYITPTDTRVLGVDKEALLAKHKYTFGVIVHYSGVPTYLFISFETPSKPRPRVMSVTPASGTGFSTSFTITFALETPTGTDGAYYQIFRKNCPGSTNEEVTLTQPFTNSNMYATTLSSGPKSCNYLVEIIVRATEFGGTVENRVNITVAEPSAPITEVLAAQIEKITSTSTASSFTMDQKLTILAEVANVPVPDQTPTASATSAAVIQQLSVLDEPGGFMDLLDPEEKPALIDTAVNTMANLAVNQIEVIPMEAAEAISGKVDDYLVAVKTQEGGSYVIPGCLAALSGVANIGVAKQSEKEFFAAMQNAMSAMTDIKLAEMLPGAAPFTVTSPSIEMVVKKVYASEFNKSQEITTDKGSSIGIPGGLSEKLIAQFNGSLTGTPVIGTAMYATSFNPFNAVRNATTISVNSLSNETLPGIKPSTVQRIYEDLAQGKLKDVVNKREQNADLLQIGFKPSQVLANSTQIQMNQSVSVGVLDPGQKSTIIIPVKNLSLFVNTSIIVPVYRIPENDSWTNDNCTMEPINPKSPNVVMVCGHMGRGRYNASLKDINFQATVDIMKDVFKVIKAGNYEQLTQISLLFEVNSRTIAAGLTVGVTLFCLTFIIILLIKMDQVDLFNERMRFLNRKFGFKGVVAPTGMLHAIFAFFASMRKKGITKVSKKSHKEVAPVDKDKVKKHGVVDTEVPLKSEKKKPSNGFNRLSKDDIIVLKDTWDLYQQASMAYDDKELLDVIGEELSKCGVLNRLTQSYIEDDIINEPLSFWLLIRNEQPIINAVAKPEITTPRPYKLMIIICALVGELFVTGYFHDTNVDKSISDDYQYFLSNAVIFTIAATLLMIPLKIIISIFLIGSMPTENMTREDIEASEKKAPMKQKIGLILSFGWVVGCLYGIAMYIVVFPDHALTNWMTTFGISTFTELIIIANLKILLKVGIGMLLMRIARTKAMMTTAGVIAGKIIDFMGRAC